MVGDYAVASNATEFYDYVCGAAACISCRPASRTAVPHGLMHERGHAADSRFTRHGSAEPGHRSPLAIARRARALRQAPGHPRPQLDCAIDYTIHIIEQAGNRPFNKARLMNAGFALVRDRADYICIHDIDYLPIWADYSYPDCPTRIVWFGLTHPHDYLRLFGGAVLFPSAQFAAVNGFSNGYWGWGLQDQDLLDRCIVAGLPIGRRDGTFGALHHSHEGTVAGTPTETAQRNLERFQSRRNQQARLMQEDGLTTLTFKVVESKTPAGDSAVVARVRHHLIDIGEPSDASR
ncbi:MAG: hypothetical protein HY246_12940 [Proteobacteria bacterium]|nr:hypothetical protein [Pseudomonadota bacterium]